MNKRGYQRKTTENPNETVDLFGYRRLREGPVRSKPTLVGNILPQIIAKYGLARKISIERFRQNFSSALAELFPSESGGERFYDENSYRLVGFRSGILQIHVSNAPLQSEFAFYKGEILRRMQKAMPEDKIRDIRFTLINN